MSHPPPGRRRRFPLTVGLAGLVGATIAVGVWYTADEAEPAAGPPRLVYKPRQDPFDSSGYDLVYGRPSPWLPSASLDQIAAAWQGSVRRLGTQLDADLTRPNLRPIDRLGVHLARARLRNFEGKPDQAYEAIEEARRLAEANPALAVDWLYTVIAFQGITALRRGETDNCIHCRGESSCVLPLAPAAVHTRPAGSRLAVRHFTEYLAAFPDDPDIRWLLNVAHMTLGEHPDGVDPRFWITLDRYTATDHAIGTFTNVGHRVGIDRFNQAGGVILDDFDGDDRLDVVFTSYDPAAPMAYYRNRGDGTFEDRTAASGLAGQLGGLYCVQADYDNDGLLDVFVPRGAWLTTPVRPSLLRNTGNGTFADVTREAGLLDPVNAITAQWADYDNDGHLDLLVCNETGRCRLYHNRGDGRFDEVAVAAGVGDAGGTWKGAAWLDYDGDRYPDLFLNSLRGKPRLYRNNRDGTFADVTRSVGVSGPEVGFSCWAFDYDNDGRPDLFASCFDHTVGDVVKGLVGEPSGSPTGRLYRNVDGAGFQDVTREAGVGLVFSAMGSNFADFDNDGFLDFYLGTGDPDLSSLFPNRMFRNVGGRRFADITGSSGTGHLQKGHAVACGDWRRVGSADLVVEMGGGVAGDSAHNALFANPGQGNNWLNVRLVGRRTNRSAIGARVKVVTAGPDSRTVYRWVSSGSSFGANPLEQLIGLGRADRVAVLEVDWPTSGTTQVFRDVAANQGIEITESVPEFRTRAYTPVPLPPARSD